MTKLAWWSKCIVVVLLVAVLATSGIACGKANQSPSITSLVANPAILAPGDGSSITCVANDSEGDALSYAWTCNGGAISGTGSEVTWVAPSIVKTYTVGVAVSDGKGGAANQSVSITVAMPTPTPTPTPADGAIDIKSDPAGAKIIIDGVDTASITPYVATHVSIGNHTVELKKAHYKWRTGNVSVNSSETAYVNWALTYADSQTLTIQPNASDGKDAYVYEYTPDTNAGAEAGMAVGGDGSARRNRIYIQFSLNSIPSTVVIENATIGLYYVTSDAAAVQGPVGVYKVTSIWNESTITWNSQPTFDATAIDSVLVPASKILSFLSWDVTSLVSSWRDLSTSNYGMVLMDADESTNERWKSFLSSDSADAGTYPNLTITYYNPVP
jgi:hypothetical protein